MNILFIADLHYLNIDNLEKIKNLSYDICILLGDIPKKYLDAIKEVVNNNKLYGITGNHDTFNLLEKNNINDINMKIININGIKIAGISGGVKYKFGMYAMLGQEELLEKITNLQKCDILVSHETGYHYLKEDIAHEGFIAIDDYLKTYNPKYHIFGHYHNNYFFIKYNTSCYCVFQCSLLNYESGEMINIF